MVRYAWLMIIGSSIMLGTAHWWPDYVCWLVYLFLTPLFYAGLSNIPIGCRHGFCWGLVFFGMQLWATTELLEHYSTPFYYCIVVAAYIYSVCHAAIWFYSAALFAHSRGVILRCIVWILSTHGFFWFLYRHGLWIIDYNLGYFGALFWLPLAVHIRAVRPIYYMGISLFSLAIIAWSMLLALWLHKRQVWILCILVSMCTLYCILIIIPPTIPRVQPPWLSHACWIPYDYMRKEHPYDRAQAIAHRITRAQQANEQLSIFILPESACQFALNDHQHLIGWWYSQLHDDTWILCGGYRRNNSDENLIYNTLYVTHNAHPITHYDKKTLVPFFEYQPTHTACNLSVKTPFFAPSCQPSHCLVTPWCTFIPMICSELFLVTHNRVKNSDIARLCLVHDGWFTRNHYMQQLMELYAHVRALVEYSPYLYISHTYGLYIDGEHKVSL